MKPYILNHKTLVVADIWPALMVIAIFAISYNLLLEYESTKTIVYYAICIAVFFTWNAALAIKHLRKYIKNKEVVYLRIDRDGIFMNQDELLETVTWDQVDEICFRRDGKSPSLFIYLSEEICIFNLDPFLDGMNVYALRRALRHFSGRQDIVKKRGVILL